MVPHHSLDQTTARRFLQALAISVLLLVLPANGSTTTRRGTVGTKDGGVIHVADSQIILPARLKQTPAVVTLQQGRLLDALPKAKQATHAAASLDENLFIQGLVELALAKQSAKIATYEDAGLSFMRVIVYFPNSPYAPLALLECGYVHQQINRPDIADKLYAQAREAIANEGGKKAYPNYYPRLNKLSER